MFNQSYPFRASHGDKFFTFKSVGPNGVVDKVIQFSRLPDGAYNLSLADVTNGKLSFGNTTNNQDIVRVLSTVAAIVLHFTEIYPASEVYLSGDSRRMRLYNAVFRRRAKEIAQLFNIYGRLNGVWETYQPERFYEALKVKRMKKHIIEEPLVAFEPSTWLGKEGMTEVEFLAIAKAHQTKPINPIKHKQALQMVMETVVLPKMRNLLQTHPNTSLKNCLLEILTDLPEDMFPEDYRAVIEAVFSYFPSR